jgi:hypothetical protein
VSRGVTWTDGRRCWGGAPWEPLGSLFYFAKLDSLSVSVLGKRELLGVD